MNGKRSDLDRWPKMSPFDGPDIRPMQDRFRRPSRQTKQTWMVVLGAGMMLVCGTILLLVVGLASFPPPYESTNWPITVVFSRTFGLERGGRVAIPALVGLLGGLAFCITGFYSIGKPILESSSTG